MRYTKGEEAEIIGDYERALVHVPDRKKRDIEAYVRWRLHEANRLSRLEDRLWQWGGALLLTAVGVAIFSTVTGTIYAQAELDTAKHRQENEVLREQCIEAILWQSKEAEA